jgi:hypothetical protein
MPIRPYDLLTGDAFVAATQMPLCLLRATNNLRNRHDGCLRVTKACATGGEVPRASNQGRGTIVPAVGAGYTGVPGKENKATNIEEFGKMLPGKIEGLGAFPMTQTATGHQVMRLIGLPSV